MKFEKDQKVYDCEAVDLAITPDGKTVILTYPITASKEPLNIGVSRETAEQLHYQLGLLLGASLDNPPPGVPGFVRMTDVSAVDAGPTESEHQIAISLTIEGGAVLYYRLAKELSASLRPRMRSAESSPPLNARRSKH